MNNTLRNRLLAAGAGGALSIAIALGVWYEGEVTTQQDGQKYHVPYRDTGGILTVCRGITGPAVIEDKLYSEAECEALEAQAYARAEAGARRQIRHYDQLNPWQQAALIDFVFNVGEGRLASSTMRQLFNAGDVQGGCNELARWVYGTVDGRKQKLAGLVKRRGTALELCLHWGQEDD